MFEKKTYTIFRMILTLGLAAVPQVAHAGGLTEAQLMGIYETCLSDQLRSLHEAIFQGKEQEPDPSDKNYGGPASVKASKYHDPGIGSARLRITYGTTFGEDHPEGDTVWRRLHFLYLDFKYHKGSLQIGGHDGVLEGDGWRDPCVGPDLVYRFCDPDNGNAEFIETRTLKLPYFDYDTETRKNRTIDNLGTISVESQTFLKTKPKLVMRKGPAKLPFLNDDTGEPIRARNGTPLEFDVGAYTSCLTTRVDQAFAIPTKEEVAARAPVVEDAKSPKSGATGPRSTPVPAAQAGESARVVK